MRELTGDLWQLALDLKADAVVITTNGFVKKDGTAVMGRGVAREAAERYPDLPKRLGKYLTAYGNKRFIFHEDDIIVITFPVKHNWWERADPKLIEESALALWTSVEHVHTEIKCVVLPRPGCGNGGLDWADVRPILETWLKDDRFVVVHNGT